MNEGKISIIIPVYNVSKYLEECLTSITTQTYKNLEIICIDDGSTDNSGEICDIFAAKDSRFKVIHQKNAGAGAARNVGLKVASGEYIAFVDSDDYIAPTMYETLINAIKDTDSDISCCELAEVYKNRTNYPKCSDNLKSYSGVDFLCLAAAHWKYYIMVNKLFKKEVAEGIFFPEGNIIDDGFYTYRIVSKSNKIVWVPRVEYYYRQRKSSVMNKEEYQKRRDQNSVSLMKQRLEFVKENVPKAVMAFEKRMLDEFVVIVSFGLIDQREKRECVKYMRRNCMHTLFKAYNFNQSVWFVLFMIFPKYMSDKYSKTKNINIKPEDYTFFD